MTFDRIEAYMEAHDFIPADKSKVRHYIENHNRAHTHNYQIVDGYLTRDELILSFRNGMTSRVSRYILGLQDNFV